MYFYHFPLISTSKILGACFSKPVSPSNPCKFCLHIICNTIQFMHFLKGVCTLQSWCPNRMSHLFKFFFFFKSCYNKWECPRDNVSLPQQGNSRECSFHFSGFLGNTLHKGCPILLNRWKTLQWRC